MATMTAQEVMHVRDDDPNRHACQIDIHTPTYAALTCSISLGKHIPCMVTTPVQDNHSGYSNYAVRFRDTTSRGEPFSWFLPPAMCGGRLPFIRIAQYSGRNPIRLHLCSHYPEFSHSFLLLPTAEKVAIFRSQIHFAYTMTYPQ